MTATTVRTRFGALALVGVTIAMLWLVIGCSSGGKNPAAPGTTGGTAPSAPSNLTITPAGAAGVHLAWHDNSDNEDGFYVYRDLANTGTPTFHCAEGPNSTHCDDSLLTPGTTYYYKVCAHNAGGSSGYAAQSVTVPAADAPQIGLSSLNVTFAATAGGANPPQNTVSVTNAGGGTLSGLGASVMYTQGQPTGWLSTSLNATTAPATLTATGTTGSLGSGTYTATILVSAPGVSNSPRTIAVAFTVTGGGTPPTIHVGTTSLSCSAVIGGPTVLPAPLAVTNSGGGLLTGLAVAVSYPGGAATGWLSANLSSTSAPSNLTIGVSTSGLTAGTYQGTLTLSAPGASNTPVTISVTFRVLAPAPAIGVSPASLAFAAGAGGVNPGPKSVSVTNSGGGTLSGLVVAVMYPRGQPVGWLTASLSSTTAPATLTATATTGTLAAGTYDGMLTVSAAGASNSPLTIAVTFTVAPSVVQARIGLSSTSLTFSAVQGGTPAPPQVVNVTNTGLGTLNDLAVGFPDGTPTWLSASLAGSTAPTTLTVNALTQGPFSVITAGTYTTRIQVASSAASNSPQFISVTYTVLPPASVLAYASYDNVMMVNSEQAATANSVYQSTEDDVGFMYFYNIGGWYTYLGAASAFKFNVQSQIAGRNVAHAVLRLYPRSLRGDFSLDPQMKLETIAQDWNPATLTWNNGYAMPSYSGAIVAYMPNNSGAVEFDVTTAVRNWASGAWGNYGFKLIPYNYGAPGYESYQATGFQSLEYYSSSSQRPQLDIDFN